MSKNLKATKIPIELLTIQSCGDSNMSRNSSILKITG